MDPNHLKVINVLVVEDDEDDWIIIKKIFSKVRDTRFNVEWARSYKEAIDTIEQRRHDAYLVDYRLGERTGTDILEQVHPERRVQPFILMTGVLDTDLEWRSLRLAAADYLVKGSFDATELSRTITYAMQRKYIEQQRVDQLIELNKAKEDFISIASHQLRTPATGVKQYLGMVVEGFVGEVPAEQLAMLKQAYESNERQLRIISDLLKVAQVDSGKLKLRLTEVDLEKLLEEVIDEQRGVVSGRGQTVNLKTCKDVPTVQVDVDVVRMVFENIIDNASKYSPEGENIDISLSQDEQFVSIEIADTGVGMEQEDLPRLFEKFTRFNNSLSTKVGGSGLGLYWAKRIIDMHGGRIDYRPNVPRGSVFTIVLPRQMKKSEPVHSLPADR